MAVSLQSARNTGLMNHSQGRRTSANGGDVDALRRAQVTQSAASVSGTNQSVLDAQSLIEQLGLGNAIRVLQMKLAYPPEVFALAARPLIDAYAQLVQMLPDMGVEAEVVVVVDVDVDVDVRAGRSAQLGGHLQRALSLTIRALDRRRGQILPRGAAPEVIGELAHRWTYAVFVAALLHDISRIGAGLRVWIWDRSNRPRLWRPAQGSMGDCGARGYRFEILPPGVMQEGADPADPADPVDPADLAMALRLFERWVPALIHDWLRSDPVVMAQLHACLTGQVDGAGAIESLLTGDARANLQPRAVAVSPAPGVSAVVSAVEPRVPPRQSDVGTDPPAFLEDVKPVESVLARQFMDWLSQGVLGGKLPVNKPDAQVHVVADGLLLVSPGIFRQFAKQRGIGSAHGVDAAKHVQREVLREGWHLRADDRVNMLCYERRRSGRGSIMIHGIVIRDPQRFIQPLPVIDPALVRVAHGASQPAV